MAGDSIDDEPRAELARVEQQIAELQQTVRDLRAGLHDADPIEPEDRAAVIYEAGQLGPT